jgi:mannose-6-phosphate isomerase-like protein (cupin superfamily)
MPKYASPATQYSPPDDEILEKSCPSWLPVWVYQKLLHLNFIDFSFLVMGVALVFRNFKATHHFHKEEETYYFAYGTGRLRLGDKEQLIHAPAVVTIPPNVVHAMTPVSSFVLLFYSFHEGPFKSIDYTYFDKHMVYPFVAPKLFSVVEILQIFASFAIVSAFIYRAF